MSLDQIINEIKKDQEIIAIGNALPTDKRESGLVKSYFKVHYQSVCTNKLQKLYMKGT